MRTGRIRIYMLAPFFLLLRGSHSQEPRQVAFATTPGATETVTLQPASTSAAQAGEFERFEATAYCVYGVTYSGVRVERGIVAADPSVLPIGSVIEVVADHYSGIYTVMDTGGLIKGRIIDIYMPDYEEAIQFGRQQVRLRILRKGWAPDTTDMSVAG